MIFKSLCVDADVQKLNTGEKDALKPWTSRVNWFPSYNYDLLRVFIINIGIYSSYTDDNHLQRKTVLQVAEFFTLLWSVFDRLGNYMFLNKYIGYLYLDFITFFFFKGVIPMNCF
jgi:hypothetical protein